MRGARVLLNAAVQRPPAVLSIQSHVVYGAAGNSAAVFPMRRLGVNVWPLNTVQFSNHTQYGKWTGSVQPPTELTDIAEGIAAIDALDKCDAVLSGYLGSEEQGAAVLDVVAKVKAANPNALYCCDPVMGHPEKGCIVAPGVAEYFEQTLAPAADIVCPNTLELGILTGRDGELNNLDDVRSAADQLLAAGPGTVFVKHLGALGIDGANNFEMLLCTQEGHFHIGAPLIPFDRPPVGVGDLTSGSLLARHLLAVDRGTAGDTVGVEAMEHTTGVYNAVMEATAALNEYELQTVAAQDAIANPVTTFTATRL